MIRRAKRLRRAELPPLSQVGQALGDRHMAAQTKCKQTGLASKLNANLSNISFPQLLQASLCQTLPIIQRLTVGSILTTVWRASVWATAS
jgi:hypothetical protein